MAAAAEGGAPADTAIPPPVMPEPAGPPRIGRILVAGNVQTDSARIVRTFEVTPGGIYSEDEVRRGLRKLFALGVFSDVYVDRVPQLGGVTDLVVHVVERPRIASIGFTGNHNRETSELERKLVLHKGEIYSPTVVQAQVDSLLRYYHDEGYALAKIEAHADTTSAREVAVQFRIQEGEKVRIRKIVFEGRTAFSNGKLRKNMKTKQKGFFGGGEVREEEWPENKEKLETFYHDHGYRDMRVVSQDLKPGDTPRHLTLVVRIDQGRPYVMGHDAWSGNTVVSTDRLQKLWKLKPGDTYDASKIDATQGGAYGEYAEEGYLYVGVEPRETVRADSIVDVTFGVTEGKPSNVHLVKITGNKATREKVIRREIDIHEGDRFKRSALVRTQGDLFRLGLFEDVKVDFTPAESTDVDIVLNVKEKQVGTASAGAGYTSQSGLTGFLELGHNNVLGNGQSLSLHLERGSNLSNYYLSFTEPWFHDTPTLLGFSAFNSQQELDLFTEKRVGGSARIGRPLGWPDYSRGSISYQLEDVTITQLGSTLTPQDSIALIGVSVNEPVLTSTVNLSFLRNSTDNPFYPTRGTKLSIEDELAGGPFGGHVEFHKHRIEGRLYLPSIFRSWTTMFRGRVGIIGQYAKPVPPYETFRLGGGTTPDPLRGYDDYQVVPEQNIRLVDVGYDTQTVTDTGDTVTTHVPVFTKVRYPGGRALLLYTIEQQFPIVHPLHGVIFFDAGNVWETWGQARPWDLKTSVGAGIRMEIPLLGNIGFDYGYGFNRDDGARGKGHLLLGSFAF